MNDKSLEILIKAALNLTESYKTIKAQMADLQNRIKNLTLKVTATLDKTASRAAINASLKAIKTTGVKTSATLDTATTRTNINATLKAMKANQLKIQGALDKTTTTRNINDQLKQITGGKVKVSVNASGAKDVAAMVRNSPSLKSWAIESR